VPGINDVEFFVVPANAVGMLKLDLCVAATVTKHRRDFAPFRIELSNCTIQVVCDVNVAGWITADMFGASKQCLHGRTVAEAFLA
jgi:hypothetical protein